MLPHWPAPWGRDAGPLEQLVIEQELSQAGIKRPGYGITGWVILTLIQHATPDQVQRWVRPALDREVIWCQLFSEPGAGSDAAGIRTRAVRAEGGWLINGQKVWTSGAHVAGFGLATVRTNPDAPKHQGITTMVIDMHAPGVTVRPLRMPTGHSDFNEVFFDDVFVPDADVVGAVDGGWTVARATLGNESVSIGGGDGGMAMPADAFIAPLDANPERLSRRGRPGRPADRPDSGPERAESAQCLPRGRRRRPRAGRQHREAAAVRGRPRGGRDTGTARGAVRGVPGRERVTRGHPGAAEPGDVDRGRDVGDQAQSDRRADPRSPPRPADQVADRAAVQACAAEAAAAERTSEAAQTASETALAAGDDPDFHYQLGVDMFVAGVVATAGQ